MVDFRLAMADPIGYRVFDAGYAVLRNKQPACAAAVMMAQSIAQKRLALRHAVAQSAATGRNGSQRVGN
jgi:hypothetical protein